MSDDAASPQVRTSAGVHAVALLEAAKGVLALAAGIGLALTGPEAMRHGMAMVLRSLHLRAESDVARWLQGVISPQGLRMAAWIALLYAAVRLVEAWGLWRHRLWASWLGALSAALYLPLDVHALLQHPYHWLAWTVVLVNLLVVGVLAGDIRRSGRRGRTAD